ncbi:MAG: endopeptidase La [Desulfobacula sp.]|uniref:endopeptidase La n=1 Tax=Desulfobacula sp. TaxID=2593537 RepID=UPI002A0FCD88|nr:endopeptidase La [Desulfobacula sp.]MBT4201199.1 endopeptidase La [Desulfobacula sp.]MBT4876947.1 endopeptidase La [Desulfobacula sp.]MBT5545784.1 endopeptidase La [Desulfobacula sp.]MBT7629866.1 endopeptidase La [Desulfobacula sp.]
MTDDTKPITPEIVEDENESKDGQLVQQSIKPDILYLIPITGRPHLPAQAQPLLVSKKRWEETLTKASKDSKNLLGLAYVREVKGKYVYKEDFPKVGCVVRMMNVVEFQGNIQFIAQGLERFRIKRFLSDKPPFVVQAEYFEKTQENENELKAYAIAIINAIKQLLSLNPLYSEEVRQYLGMFSPDQPSLLTDFAAGITTASGDDLQKVLELSSVMDRMKKVMMLLQKEIEIAKLQSKIQKDVNTQVDENKRKFFLKEQLKAIQKELGLAKDDKTSDVEKFKKKFAKLEPPEHVTKRFNEEIEKLSVLETGSSEYGVTRNYLDWITSFPWGVYSKDNIDIDRAEKVLDRDHAGLSDVKERIIEFFAAGIYKKDIAGSIILFVGPPGVGKTSIGKSIAEAVGRKFYRFSLGGMRDEAEIKGHRRTYVGALPGKLVQALKDTEVANPVIMLDEVDKIGMSYQGDPASALLEVLDPEQNSEFLDHYMDLRIDLSKVLFICTANQLDTIPRPLLDRMDQINLSGYITQEKMEIARKHLWPRLLKRNNLTSKKITITDPTIRHLIEGFAREAGVRNLEKLLNKIIRKSIVSILKEKKEKIRINIKSLEDLLGPPVFKDDNQMSGIGVITGLAWTQLGGVTLPIEAIRVHEKNSGFQLTGKLGEVMQESATIAYSYVRANLSSFKINKDYFDNAFIHIHVPEGATPKDGPSAGITITTAIVSLATGKRIKRPLAMTGEITLTGEVLPVGGIKEKIIAARRSNIREIILPDGCIPDFKKLPEHIKEGITFHFAKKYKDVFKIVFTK